jgi:hypothetical protein
MQKKMVKGCSVTNHDFNFLNDESVLMNSTKYASLDGQCLGFVQQHSRSGNYYALNLTADMLQKEDDDPFCGDILYRHIISLSKRFFFDV